MVLVDWTRLDCLHAHKYFLSPLSSSAGYTPLLFFFLQKKKKNSTHLVAVGVCNSIAQGRERSWRAILIWKLNCLNLLYETRREGEVTCQAHLVKPIKCAGA